MRTSLLISLFLSISFCCQVYCQNSEECDTQIQKIGTLASKFSRLPLEKTYTTADSFLRATEMGDCLQAELDANTVVGRYYKEKGNYSEAEKYFDIAYEIATTTNNVIRKKDILVLMSVIEKESGRFDNAINLLDSAYSLLCPIDSVLCYKSNVKLMINKGTFRREQFKYQEAINDFSEADSLLDHYEIKDSIYKVAVFNTMGNIYDDIGDHRSSLSCYFKSLKYCPSKHSAKFSILNNIGHRYRNLDQPDSSIHYYNKTISVATADRFLVTPYQGLGDIAIDNKDYVLGLKHYSTALGNAKKSSSKLYILYTEGLVGKAHYLLDHYDLAKKYLSSSKEQMIEIDYGIENIAEVERYLVLNEMSRISPKLESRLDTFLQDLDTIYDARRTEAVSAAVAKYDQKIVRDSLQNLQLEASNKSLEAKNSKLFNLVLLFGLSFLSFLGFVLYRKNAKQKVEIDSLIFENSEINTINSQLAAKVQQLSHLEPPVPQTKLELKTRDKVHIVDESEIFYIIAEDNGIRVFLGKDKSIWVDQRLKEMISSLSGKQFMQIHRSSMINLIHVDWVNHSSLRMNDGKELKIGRTYKKNIIEIFN